jgi:hypothetical protein
MDTTVRKERSSNVAPSFMGSADAGFDVLTGGLSWVWPDLNFVFPAPSGAPLDPDEPDQRPGPYDHLTKRGEPPPEGAG